VEEIVEALERLYADRKHRENIGASVSSWIREHGTWQIHVDKLNDLAVSLH